MFAAAAHAARFSTTVTLMGVFTLGRAGSFAVPAAAPCRPSRKTATAEMPDNGLGGNVLLWALTHLRCFPRAAVGQLPVNSGRKGTPPPRLLHWKSWYALYSPSYELSVTVY